MPTLFVYMLKLSCSLAVIWLFYRLLLRNLTFYDLNRWYLLGYSLLAFLIPLIDIGPALEGDRPEEPLVLQFIPAIGEITPALAHTPENRGSTWSVWTIASGILLVGTLLLLVRIIVRWLALRQLRRSAILVRDGEWKIYQVDEMITPFSFGKAIFINRGLHTDREWEEIILHEYEHVRGRHTVDIVIAEWLTVLNWYNPFAWLIRHSIRQNLEFIADRRVLAGGFDRKGYQYHLLKAVGLPRYRLANNFNFSSLKKRIVMMNKLRSARLHLVKFLFILPLSAVLLVAFRDHYNVFRRRPGGPVYINAAGIVVGLPGRAPVAGVMVREKSTGQETITDANGYYKLNILVTHDSMRVHIGFSKEGYGPSLRDRVYPSLKETIGILDIVALTDLHRTDHEGIAIALYMHRGPADPSYRDVLAAYKETIRMNEDYKRFFAMQKAHPEVALFYTVAGRYRKLVVHTDGTVERYGYPEGPAIGDLESKYGPLTPWLRRNDPGPGADYVARWESISACAEKEFHTMNHTARAIIFPGDSRVIAVDATGKARVYDMNNDAPEERPAFEQKYGRLPDCVPAGTHYPDKQDTLPTPRFDSPRIVRDSLRIPKEDSTPKPSHEVIRFGSWPPRLSPLFVIDGVETDTSALRTLNPSTIKSIEVLKDSAAEARYGSKGKNGVVIINLKPLAPLKP